MGLGEVLAQPPLEAWLSAVNGPLPSVAVHTHLNSLKEVERLHRHVLLINSEFRWRICLGKNWLGNSQTSSPLEPFPTPPTPTQRYYWSFKMSESKIWRRKTARGACFNNRSLLLTTDSRKNFQEPASHSLTDRVRGEAASFRRVRAEQNVFLFGLWVCLLYVQDSGIGKGDAKLFTDKQHGF